MPIPPIWVFAFATTALLVACAPNESLIPPTPAPATPTATPAPPTPTPTATPVPQPTPQPTAVPAKPAPAPVAAPAPSTTTRCPATGEAQQEIGLSVVRLGSEACAWTWRSVPQVVEATVPSGYIATIHRENDKIVVVVGSGQRMRIKAATLRFSNGYPAGDAVRLPCQLLAKEQAFGQSERPSFTVEPLGFTC